METLNATKYMRLTPAAHDHLLQVQARMQAVFGRRISLSEIVEHLISEWERETK